MTLGEIHRREPTEHLERQPHHAPGCLRAIDPSDTCTCGGDRTPPLSAEERRPWVASEHEEACPRHASPQGLCTCSASGKEHAAVVELHEERRRDTPYVDRLQPTQRSLVTLVRSFAQRGQLTEVERMLFEIIEAVAPEPPATE